MTALMKSHRLAPEKGDTDRYHKLWTEREILLGKLPNAKEKARFRNGLWI